ncbi:MAG: hypothetical protein ACK4UJ_07645 [Leptonema sp. (in: bacteria)]
MSNSFYFDKNELLIYPDRYRFLFYFLTFVAIIIIPIYFVILYDVIVSFRLEKIHTVLIIFCTLVFIGLYSVYNYRKSVSKKIIINKENTIFEYSKNSKEIINNQEFPFFGTIKLQKSKSSKPHLFLYNDKKNLLISLVELPFKSEESILNFFKENNFQLWNENKKEELFYDEFDFLNITKNNFKFLKDNCIERRQSLQIKEHKYFFIKTLVFFTLVLFFVLFFKQVVLVLSPFEIDQIGYLLGFIFSFGILILFFVIVIKSIYNSFFNLELIRQNQHLLIYKVFIVSWIPIRYLYRDLLINESFATFLKIFMDTKISKIEIYNDRFFDILKVQKVSFIEYIYNRLKLKKEILEIYLYGWTLTEILSLYKEINCMVKD